jgi:copper chaperone CopZ
MTNRVLLVFFALIFSISCAERGQKAGEEKDVSLDSTRLVTVKFSVEGMTCTGCENTVNYAVGEMEGVTEVVSSHEERYTLVTFDSLLVSGEEIGKVINSKGYTFQGVCKEE